MLSAAAAVSDDGRELLVMANNLAGETRDDVTLEFAHMTPEFLKVTRKGDGR